MRTSISGPAILGGLAALIAASPLLAVGWVAASSPFGDYLAHLLSTRFSTYLLNTLLVTLTAIIGAGIIGVATGWIIARLEFPGRSILNWALALPLAVPAYVAAYAWLDLTQAAGPLQTPLRDAGLGWLSAALPTIRGPVGAGFIFALTLYPYVYLLARQAFIEQDPDTQLAARTLGASSQDVFLKVTLPLVRPALAAGLALVAMESLADFGAVAHLGAPTLTVGIVRAWAGAGSLPDAARIAIALIALAFLALALERQGRTRSRFTSNDGKHHKFARRRLPPLLGFTALLVCVTPILLGLVMPLGRLLYLSSVSPAAQNIWSSLQNSLTLAAITATLAITLGLGAAYAIRSRSTFGTAASRLASIGYASPGAVAAVGVLVLFAGLQGALDAAFGGQFPILLTSTMAALVFAYLSRFAAVAIAPSDSALMRITPSLDQAAATLGASNSRIIREVHWPMILPGIATAGLLVFVEVMKELPATMILRPFNMDTLAVVAHNYAADERLGQAALPSLIIVLATLPAMVLASRNLMTKKRDHA